MPTIQLETIIDADIYVCFNVARSIDFHSISTSATREKAIAGKISGLIELDEYVTWEASHFGIRQKLTSIITAMEKPYHFRDEQVKGAFKCIKHDHYFTGNHAQTIMKDVFYFESPYGILGKMFNKLVLVNYMQAFLNKRNALIKECAQSRQWETLW